MIVVGFGLSLIGHCNCPFKGRGFVHLSEIQTAGLSTVGGRGGVFSLSLSPSPLRNRGGRAADGHAFVVHKI